MTIFSQDFHFKTFYMTKSMPLELYAMTENFFPEQLKSYFKKGLKQRGEHKVLQNGNLVNAL